MSLDDVFTIDVSGPLPPGKYQLEVEAITPFVSKAGARCMRVRFRVIEPEEHADDTVEDRYPLEGRGAVFGARLLRACGVQVGAAGTHFSPRDLIGRTITARVTHEEYRGIVRARVHVGGRSLEPVY